MSTKVAMATGPFQDGVGCGNWARAVASWPGQATVRTVAGCSPGWAGLTARGRSWRDGVGALDILGVHDAGLTLDGGQSERGFRRGWSMFAYPVQCQCARGPDAD